MAGTDDPGRNTTAEAGVTVTLRPHGARLARAQADGIATLAAAHGIRHWQLTPQGHLQILGVPQDSHDALVSGLRHLSLMDRDAQTGAPCTILITPFWQTGDETEALVPALADALAAPEAATLPQDLCFALDTGRRPVLAKTSADIRLERDAGGGLILIAGDAPQGRPVSEATAISEAVALAASGGTQDAALVPRQTATGKPQPGPTPLGALVELAEGPLPLETLARLAKQGALRLTPWRMVLIEAARDFPSAEGVLVDPAQADLA